MNQSSLHEWLHESRKQVINRGSFEDSWWPRTATDASRWALAFMIHIATVLEPDNKELTVATHILRSAKDRASLLGQAGWKGQHQKWEMITDFAVFATSRHSEIKLTGESEVYARHSVGISLDHDYAWDFFKLLLVPSPRRIFVARIAGSERVDTVTRCKELAKSLTTLIEIHIKLLRDGDQLGVVILPETPAFADQTQLLWMEQREIKQATIDPRISR